MKTALNVRIDTQLKKQLEQIAQEMGLSLSALVSASLTKLGRTRRLEMLALTENGFTPEYETDLLSDPEAKETVFVASTPEDIDKFFEALDD